MKTFKKIILITILPFFILFLFLYREYNIKKRANLTSNNIETPVKNDAVCTEEYAPVCGEDNNTYSNSCVAEKQNNINIKHTGICKNEENTVEENSGETIGESNLGTIPTENNGETNIETGNTTEEKITETSTETGTTNINSTGALTESGTIDGIKVINYFNSSFNYGFSIPANSYYSGFGSQEGANHTIGINSGTGITDFASADIKIYFYKNKIIDELKGSHYGFYQKDAKTYLQVGNSSMIIEVNPEKTGLEKTLNTIIKTVYEK